MTLVLRPRGRGNWATVTLVLTGARATPLTFRVGETLPLGGITFRICAVQP